jgi:hypothetical protein
VKTPKSVLIIWDNQGLAERGHERCSGWWSDGPFVQCGCGQLRVTYLEKLYV